MKKISILAHEFEFEDATWKSLLDSVRADSRHVIHDMKKGVSRVPDDAEAEEILARMLVSVLEGKIEQHQQRQLQAPRIKARKI